MIIVPLTKTYPVKCEAFGRKASTISEILQVHHVASDVGKGERTPKKLPFVNLKYRAEVRVVDFFPCKLEDFAVRRKISEYDALSGNEDDGESSDGSSVSGSYGGGGGGTYVWEWRFTLVLEDAVAESKGGAPVRMEVLVDKLEGQCLTGLDPEEYVSFQICHFVFFPTPRYLSSPDALANRKAKP